MGWKESVIMILSHVVIMLNTIINCKFRINDEYIFCLTLMPSVLCVYVFFILSYPILFYLQFFAQLAFFVSKFGKCCFNPMYLKYYNFSLISFFCFRNNRFQLDKFTIIYQKLQALDQEEHFIILYQPALTLFDQLGKQRTNRKIEIMKRNENFLILFIYIMQLNEKNIIGSQNEIQAEQFPVYTGMVLQPGIGYNGGQAVQGIPIQVQQPQYGYSNQQYVYNQYQPRQSGPYQQVVYMNNQAPGVVVVQANPILNLEYLFRHQCKWFNGCSCVQSIYMILILIVRASVAFFDDSTAAAGVFYILENVCWFGCLPIGLMAISRFKMEYLRYYQIGLSFALLFEIVGDIIMFAVSPSSPGYNPVGFIILMIIQIILISLFIRRARNLKVVMQELQTMREKQQQQPQQYQQ
ncbi:hypothetical protein pb186bvf_015419 [Paramecium bursaria]